MFTQKILTFPPKNDILLTFGASILTNKFGNCNVKVSTSFLNPVSPSKDAYFSMTHSTSKRSYIKIYTKTGDKGTSALYSGERKLKSDDRFQSLGHVDELNANIGLAREFVEELLQKISHEAKTMETIENANTKLKKLHVSALQMLSSQLEEIQSRLLDVGSSIATPLKSSKENQLNRVQFSSENTKFLEQWIDMYEETLLPPLKNFILPSGGLASSQLHICRTVCRRAERSIVPLLLNDDVDELVLQYMNRMSDYLFTVARVAAFCNEKSEVTYKKEKIL